MTQPERRASLSFCCWAARSDRFWTIFMFSSLRSWNARNCSCKASLSLMNAWRYSFSSIAIIKITIILVCDRFKNSCFSLIHLPSCYRTVQSANHTQSCSLNQPVITLVSITIKTVYKLLNRRGLSSKWEFFLTTWLDYDNIFEDRNDFVWKLSLLRLIGNKTSCCPIRSVIIFALLE